MDSIFAQLAALTAIVSAGAVLGNLFCWAYERKRSAS